MFAGALADLLGRKKLMLVGGLMFVVSIGLIFISSGYVALLLGRILMGLSGGVVCVVVPLYMAECLPAESRGRGTSVFQLLLTLGFVLAAFIATHFAAVHEAAVKAALGDPEKIFAADDSAWRHIFLTACIPGVLFTIAAVLVSATVANLVANPVADSAAELVSDADATAVRRPVAVSEVPLVSAAVAMTSMTPVADRTARSGIQFCNRTAPIA